MRTRKQGDGPVNPRDSMEKVFSSRCRVALPARGGIEADLLKTKPWSAPGESWACEGCGVFTLGSRVVKSLA